MVLDSRRPACVLSWNEPPSIGSGWMFNSILNSLQVFVFIIFPSSCHWGGKAECGWPFSEENLWNYPSMNVSSSLISVICHLPAPMDIIDKVRVDIPKNIRSNSHCKFKCYHPIQYVHNIVWYSYFSSIILM